MNYSFTTFYDNGFVKGEFMRGSVRDNEEFGLFELDQLQTDHCKSVVHIP